VAGPAEAAVAARSRREREVTELVGLQEQVRPLEQSPVLCGVHQRTLVFLPQDQGPGGGEQQQEERSEYHGAPVKVENGGEKKYFEIGAAGGRFYIPSVFIYISEGTGISLSPGRGMDRLGAHEETRASQISPVFMQANVDLTVTLAPHTAAKIQWPVPQINTAEPEGKLNLTVAYSSQCDVQQALPGTSQVGRPTGYGSCR